MSKLDMCPLCGDQLAIIGRRSSWCHYRCAGCGLMISLEVQLLYIPENTTQSAYNDALAYVMDCITRTERTKECPF